MADSPFFFLDVQFKELQQVRPIWWTPKARFVHLDFERATRTIGEIPRQK